MTLNNDDRIAWIMNNEFLYQWWQSEKMGIYRFIKNNKKEIDNYIKQQRGEK